MLEMLAWLWEFVDYNKFRVFKQFGFLLRTYIPHLKKGFLIDFYQL